MSFILLGILNSQTSAAGKSYWLSYAFDPSSLGNAFYWGIAKELVINGQTTVGANEAGIIAKLNPDGTTNWRRTVVNTTGDLRVFGTRGIVSDGTNHFAMYQDEQSGNSDLILIKFNDTPSIVTQRELGGSANFKVAQASIAADSSYNIVAGGHYEATGNEVIFGVWNSSLTFQFQRRIDPTNGDFYDPFFRFDSSGNIITGFQWNPSSGSTQVQILKYNSSGTAQWQRGLDGTNDLPQVVVATDSSDNVYASYRDQTTSGWGAGLAKWNSSGTLQFQKTLFRASWNYVNNGDLVQGPDGNIYAAHTLSDGGTSRLFVVSYDTSGNVNWQRYIDYAIGGVNTESTSHDITFNSDGDLLITGTTYDTISGFKRYAVAMVLPSNGDFIGNFSNGFFEFIGEAGSHSVTNTSHTGVTTSHTLNTPSLTEAASSLSLATRTLTEDKVNIG